jgi:hypothetical protein
VFRCIGHATGQRVEITLGKVSESVDLLDKRKKLEHLTAQPAFSARSTASRDQHTFY